MQAAVKEMPESKFVIPQGMNLIPIDRKTGMAAIEGDPNTIIEAFKPGTGPADSLSVIGMDSTMAPEEILKTSPQANQAVQSGAGGLLLNLILRHGCDGRGSLHPRPPQLFSTDQLKTNAKKQENASGNRKRSR